MKTFSQFFTVIGATALVTMSGCASVMSGRTADVTVKTNVPNARVVVRDKCGQEVASAPAPASFSLNRKEKFLRPARYIATIEAPGYQTVDVPIQQTVNPWIMGNVVFGGLIGLAVDNATGAAWRPTHPNIYQELQPIYPTRPPIETAQRLPDPNVQQASTMY